MGVIRQVWSRLNAKTNLVSIQPTNPPVEHDFAQQHVLQRCHSFWTVHGIVTFKCFVEVGKGGFEVFLIRCMKNTWKATGRNLKCSVCKQGRLFVRLFFFCFCFFFKPSAAFSGWWLIWVIMPLLLSCHHCHCSCMRTHLPLPMQFTYHHKPKIAQKHKQHCSSPSSNAAHAITNLKLQHKSILKIRLLASTLISALVFTKMSENQPDCWSSAACSFGGQ